MQTSRLSRVPRDYWIVDRPNDLRGNRDTGRSRWICQKSRWQRPTRHSPGRAFTAKQNKAENASDSDIFAAISGEVTRSEASRACQVYLTREWKLDFNIKAAIGQLPRIAECRRSIKHRTHGKDIFATITVYIGANHR